MRAFILIMACLSGCITVAVEKKPEEVPAVQPSQGILQQAIESSPPPVPPEITVLQVPDEEPPVAEKPKVAAPKAQAEPKPPRERIRVGDDGKLRKQ